MANILEVKGRDSSARCYLDGAPVRAGEPLQLQIYGGHWIAGVFEWDAEAGGRPRLRIRSPVNIPLDLSTFVIKEHALVRRPSGASHRERIPRLALTPSGERFPGAPLRAGTGARSG